MMHVVKHAVAVVAITLACILDADAFFIQFMNWTIPTYKTELMYRILFSTFMFAQIF